MSSNNSTDCQTFSDEEVKTIFKVRLAVAALSAVACFLCLCVLSIMICCVRVWKTFVHRLKLYLMVVALVLSIMYLLQALPMKDGALNDHETLKQKWNTICKPIIFFLQYFDWMLLILISVVTVHLLLLVHHMHTLRQHNSFHFQYHWWREAVMIIFTITVPLFIVWIPFINDHYGLKAVWCGIVWQENGTCGSSETNVKSGIGYELGTWYVPGLLLSFLNAVGLSVVAGYFWFYYRKRNYTETVIMSAVVRGLPSLIYLTLYDIISIIDFTSLLYHEKYGTTRGKVDYHLWLTHAVTGPCRALAIPIAFVLVAIFVRHCFKRRGRRYITLT